VAFAVENRNQPPVEAVLVTVTTTSPSGWTANAAAREFSLGPGNVTFSALEITSPDRGSGAGVGNVSLHVTFVCPRGDVRTTSAADAIVHVRLAQLSAPWPLAVGAVLVLGSAVTVLALRRVRRGVALVPKQRMRTMRPGQSVKFNFDVENRRGRPSRFHLLVEGLPDGWSAHLALDRVDLEPGEEKALWAIVHSPIAVTPGTQVEFQLRLEPLGGGRDHATLHLGVTVTLDGA